MPKTIFISCGQYTPAEKQLGKQISEMVRTLTDCVPFFAEEVQDLNGLDANILSALHDCVGFITVLHPRGEINRPNGSIVRASVWIEQEIAVATYIQRVEKRTLPIIAFKHKSVGREGIRDLLNLNPFEFTDETEILTELPKRLAAWRSLMPSGIELQLSSKAAGRQEGHDIRRLEITLLNGTNRLIEKYEVEARLPSSILKHWSATYPTEVRHNIPGLRCFRFDQNGRGALRPHDRMQNPITFEYCETCARPEHESTLIGAMLVSELNLAATAWVEENEYVVEKTIKQLAIEGSRLTDRPRGRHMEDEPSCAIYMTRKSKPKIKLGATVHLRAQSGEIITGQVVHLWEEKSVPMVRVASGTQMEKTAVAQERLSHSLRSGCQVSHCRRTQNLALPLFIFRAELFGNANDASPADSRKDSPALPNA